VPSGFSQAYSAMLLLPYSIFFRDDPALVNDDDSLGIALALW
jgi:hypothetical protein